MEILNQLEEKVNFLLARFETLQEENALLKARVESVSIMEEENKKLKAELEDERQKNQAALVRVNAILDKIANLPD